MRSAKINKPGKSYKNCIRLEGCHQCDAQCKEYKTWLYKKENRRDKRGVLTLHEYENLQSI